MRLLRGGGNGRRPKLPCATRRSFSLPGTATTHPAMLQPRSVRSRPILWGAHEGYYKACANPRVPVAASSRLQPVRRLGTFLTFPARGGGRLRRLTLRRPRAGRLPSGRPALPRRTKPPPGVRTGAFAYFGLPCYLRRRRTSREHREASRHANSGISPPQSRDTHGHGFPVRDTEKALEQAEDHDGRWRSPQRSKHTEPLHRNII